MFSGEEQAIELDIRNPISWPATLELQDPGKVIFTIKPVPSGRIYIHVKATPPIWLFPVPSSYQFRLTLVNAETGSEMFAKEPSVREGQYVVLAVAADVDTKTPHRLTIDCPGSAYRKILGVSVWSPKLTLIAAPMRANRRVHRTFYKTP